MTRLEPQSFKPVFAMPALFLLYLILLAVISSNWNCSVCMWPLYAYLILLALSVTATSLTAPLRPVLLTLLLIPALHASYGAGFITGLLTDKKAPEPVI
ncbi:MAG: hypothetical protein GX410_09945 [Elusimicrobia bacterium]|nr:hypothetical protein [Elusimicrobiota bacterium]